MNSQVKYWTVMAHNPNRSAQSRSCETHQRDKTGVSLIETVQWIGMLLLMGYLSVKPILVMCKSYSE
jgi:hypothetical protein